MKYIPTTLLLTSALAYVLGSTSVSAQNETFAAGDLVLYFQKFGDGDTVYANIGNAATLFRGTAAGPDASNRVNFLNINTALTSAFGAGWASDPDVYAGLAGVWGFSNTNIALQDGDPHRTLYISNSRTAVGTVGQPGSSVWDLFSAGTGAMTSGATNIFTQNNVFEVSFNEAVVLVSTATSQIDNQNPFINQEIQDNAFNTFAGGVQQRGTTGSFDSFGAAGSVEFALDLYRILARNNIAGQVAGDLRVGSYEGTVTVNSSGMVSFISQAAATTTPFEDWALTFPALDTAAKRLAAAIPSNDGMTNLMKFVLNGNPSIPASAAITPQLNASGTNFVFSFNRRQDSVAETTQVVQYGSDLAGWTDVAIPATGTGVAVGSATITVTSNGTTDSVAVTVPKSVTGTGKLFGRLKVTQ
jgi:hypothetical protein